MKKLLAIIAVGLFLVLFSFACGRKNNPLSATSNSIKVKDAAPVTVVTNMTIAVTISNGLTVANCANNSINSNLYCGPYPPNTTTFTVPLTMNIPPEGSLIDGALYIAGEDLASVQVNGTNVHVLLPANDACGAVLWSNTEFGQIVESYDFQAISNLFPANGPSNITLNFETDGCFAYGLLFTYSEPVTTILTPVPNTPTPVPTNTPVPTATATPVPTCPGTGYTSQAVSYKQAGQTWSSDTMPLGSPAQPCGPPPSGNTIQCAGCLLTCFSMITGQNPQALDGFLSSSSQPVTTFLDGGGLLLDSAFDALNLCSQQTATDPTIDDITGLMSQNQFLLMKLYNITTGDTHFVIITGAGRNPTTGQCDFTINDPGSSQANHQYLSYYSSNGWQLMICYGINSVSNT